MDVADEKGKGKGGVQEGNNGFLTIYIYITHSRSKALKAKNRWQVC